jgi:hypothetical protein
VNRQERRENERAVKKYGLRMPKDYTTDELIDRVVDRFKDMMDGATYCPRCEVRNSDCTCTGVRK